MKKLKLRRKNNRVRSKIFLITITVMIIIVLMLLYIIGNKINDKILMISEMEVSRISKVVINESVNKTISDHVNISELFHITKDSNGDIKMVDFDSQVVNEMLDVVNENVKKYFIELENGTSSIIDLGNNFITNTEIISNKNGIIFEIPIGMVSNNAFLSNVGPKIPVKISLTSEMESNIKTEIEEYGINNSVLKILINVAVSEQIILPLISKKVTVENDVPIAIKMIQGQIPNYYFQDGIIR